MTLDPLPTRQCSFGYPYVTPTAQCGSLGQSAGVGAAGCAWRPGSPPGGTLPSDIDVRALKLGLGYPLGYRNAVMFLVNDAW